MGHSIQLNLLCELLELFVYKLNLGSDDDLHSGLARADDTGGTGGLDLSLVDQQAVLHFQTQTGDAVIDGGDVLLAAQAFQNDGSHCGVVVIGQLDLHLAVLIVLTAGGLQIPLLDGKVEHGEEHGEGSDTGGGYLQLRRTCRGRG